MTAPRRLPFQPVSDLSQEFTISGVTWVGRNEPYRHTRENLYQVKVASL